jgi:hypothetical protein
MNAMYRGPPASNVIGGAMPVRPEIQEISVQRPIAGRFPIFGCLYQQPG